MSEQQKEFDRIWLQTCGDSMSEWFGEITWCYDKVNDDDVEYVNARLYAEQAAMLNQVIAERDGLMEALDGLMDAESRGRIMPIGKEWDSARAAIAKVKP